MRMRAKFQKPEGGTDLLAGSESPFERAIGLTEGCLSEDSEYRIRLTIRATLHCDKRILQQPRYFRRAILVQNLDDYIQNK